MMQLSTPLTITTIAVSIMVIAVLVLLMRRRQRAMRLKDQEAAETGKTQLIADLTSLSQAHLEVTLVPERLDLTLFNTSLSCRLNLENQGKTTIVALRIYADMIAAHASEPPDQQLRGPVIENAQMHRIEQIDPHQKAEIELQTKLHFSQIKPITQGEAKMTLPLVRIRIVGAGTPPVSRTFVVGIPSPQGERLQPIMLSNGPQAHTNLSARALN